MYADDVLVSAPYGAAGLGLPQIIQKNANHAAPAIAGTERNRAIGTSGDRCDLSRSTIDHAKRGGDYRKPAVQPRQQRQRGACCDQPSRGHFPQVRQIDEQPHADRNAKAADDLGIDREGVEEIRRGGEHCRNAGPRARDAARYPPREPPDDRGRQRRDQNHRQDRTGITGDRKRRQDDDRDARRVNRVDLAACRSLQEVRLETARKIIEVIAVRIVVRDAQIEVLEDALCRCEVMRLVAAGNDATHLAERRERGDRDQRARDPGCAIRTRDDRRRPPQPDRNHACDGDQPDKRFRWSLPDQERRRKVTRQERQPDEERAEKRPGFFEDAA